MEQQDSRLDTSKILDLFNEVLDMYASERRDSVEYPSDRFVYDIECEVLEYRSKMEMIVESVKNACSKSGKRIGWIYEQTKIYNEKSSFSQAWRSL